MNLEGNKLRYSLLARPPLYDALECPSSNQASTMLPAYEPNENTISIAGSRPLQLCSMRTPRWRRTTRVTCIAGFTRRPPCSPSRHPLVWHRQLSFSSRRKLRSDRVGTAFTLTFFVHNQGRASLLRRSFTNAFDTRVHCVVILRVTCACLWSIPSANVSTAVQLGPRLPPGLPASWKAAEGIPRCPHHGFDGDGEPGRWTSTKCTGIDTSSYFIVCEWPAVLQCGFPDCFNW